MNIKTFFLICTIFIFKNYNTKKIKVSKYKKKQEYFIKNIFYIKEN